jgi:PPOX class probable F420-dependent enzyme
MSEREILDLLAATRTITLATINSDGTPHLTAMWFALVDEQIHMWTYARSQKAVNLRRDPRATVLAEAGDTYDTLRGAELRGSVEIIDDPDTIVEIGRALGRRNRIGDHSLDAWAVATARKRVGLRFVVRRSATWDHRKL